MELDLENLIREKVKAAERKPVAWRKEAVWSTLSKNLQPQRRKISLNYYAAAACVGVFISGAIYFQLQHTEREFERKMSVLKTQLEKAELAYQEAQQPTPSIQEEICSESATPTINIRRDQQALPVTSIAVVDTTTVEHFVLPEDVRDSKIVADASTTKKRSTVKRQPVTPIIGVYDTTFKVTPLVLKKKSKLRWFKHQELDQKSTGEDHHIISARIN